MDSCWKDVTIPMTPGMPVWPGDPEFQLTPESRMARGDSCNLSRISLSTHTGTHCDAPWHFMEDGKTLDQIAPAIFFGKALLLDCTQAASITADHLPDTPLPARVLIQTTASARPADAPFDTEFAAVTPDAAQKLVDAGVRMIGFDGPSVGAYQESAPTHEILLGADVVIIEGLRLGGCTAGWYEFIVLPMALIGVDGAPCRAFLRPLPESS